MRPPAPSAPAHPSPQQRLGAWREPFGDFFVGRVLGSAPLFHSRGLMQWGPEVLGWCRAKLRPVTARQGHRSLPPVCDACPSPCPQLGGVPKPPSPRLSSAGRPLPASSVGRVGFPSCAIRRPAGSQERSEPATALAPSPLCSPEGVRGGGGDTAGLGAEPSCAPPAHLGARLRAGWGETEAGNGEKNSSRGNSGALHGIGTGWVPTRVMLSPSQCRGGGLQKGMRVPPAPQKHPQRLTPPKHPGGSLPLQPAATAR